MSLDSIKNYLIELRTHDNMKAQADQLVEQTLDELSKGKINYYLSKAVLHHDDNDKANKSYDSIDFKKGSATYKAVKARQKEHKDVIRRRSSGIKLANRRLQTAQENLEYFLENYDQLDELSKGKINYYLSKAVPHHDVNDKANKSYDSIDFKKGSATYKAVKARQKEHKDVIRRRSSGIKLANRRLQTAQEDLEYFLENYNQLDEISKQKLLDYIGHAAMDKSMASHDHAYHQGVNYGKSISGKKNVSHDVDYLDKLSKRHGRRSGGIQLAAAKLAGNGVDKYSRARVAATNESSELDNIVNKETMPELYARIMNRKAAMDKLNSEMEKAPHEIELF